MNLDKRLTEAAKRVARLEVELAEARRLAHIEAEQRVKLRAANAALAAALRVLRDLLPEYTAETEEGTRLNITATIDAALSDTAGEG